MYNANIFFGWLDYLHAFWENQDYGTEQCDEPEHIGIEFHGADYILIITVFKYSVKWMMPDFHQRNNAESNQAYMVYNSLLWHRLHIKYSPYCVGYSIAFRLSVDFRRLVAQLNPLPPHPRFHVSNLSMKLGAICDLRSDSSWDQFSVSSRWRVIERPLCTLSHGELDPSILSMINLRGLLTKSPCAINRFTTVTYWPLPLMMTS